MRFRIAVSSMALEGKLEKGDPRWGEFNRSFRNLELEPADIAHLIRTGHAYTCWLKDGWRCRDNFQSAQFIPLDMDTEDGRSAFSELAQHDWVRMYAGLLHTTCSHTPARPRARLLFFLDKPIDDPAGYKAAAQFLAAQFDGADMSSASLCQSFFGASDCEIRLLGTVLPLAHLRVYYRRWRASQPQVRKPSTVRHAQGRPGSSYATTTDLVRRLVDPVCQAMPGNRNNTLNCQAFLAGKDIAAGRLTESDVAPRLLEAGLATGLDEREATDTIRRAMRGGMGV